MFVWIILSKFLLNNTGIYTVRIALNSSITTENSDGCFVDRVITVSSSSIATINNIEVINGNAINIAVSGIGNYEFTLDNINGPYQDNNIFSNIEAGLHTLYVRDKNDCGIKKIDFSIIGYPKFFTPNGDEINDKWSVKGVSELFQPNAKIYIFDRYGKLIKQLSPLGEGWDGTFNGTVLPASDYWFSVQLQDGRIYKNHFTLKR